MTQIQVIDLDQGNLDPAQNVDYCYGTTPPTIISSTTGGTPDDATSSNGTITYRWEMSTNLATWSTIVSATNNFYSPASLIETTWFRRVARSTIDDTNFCEATTDPIRIGILPDLNEGFVLTDQSICQIITAADLPSSLELRSAETLSNSVTYQWQQSADQFSWTDIDGERANILTFGLADSWLPSGSATYYRAVITYVGDPAPASIEQTTVQFIDEGATFIGNQTYTIVISGIAHSVVSTNTSTVDAIGEALAILITTNDFNVNAVYNDANNILTIQPIIPGSFDVASSTGSPSPTIAFVVPETGRELNMKILVSGDTGSRAPNTNLDSCQVYTEVVTIEVTPQPTFTQIDGLPSPQLVCAGDAIDPITFSFGGGATSIEIRNLDPGLTLTAPGGIITNPFGGLTDSYEVSGTNTFTISGAVAGVTTIDFITNGSGCTELNDLYVFQIDSNAIVPDFIRMDLDAVGYEVLENPDVPGVWFNNTVCQDNLAAPTTASSEFFACFVNDGLNRQFNSYEWNWTPTNAGVIISNDFQETTVGIVETGVGSTVGVDYAVIITANSITNTYTFTTTVASQSADIVGLELSNLIDINANVSSIYNNITNQIIIESLSANTAFTVQSTPTGTDQFLRLLTPVTEQIGRSGTMTWDPSFSGTATIRVRSSGCDGDSGWLEVQIDVVPETVVATPTSSDLLEPDAFDFEVCGGEFTGPIPECQIIATTPDTQFFTASDNGTDPNEFASLEWQVSNPQPGLGSLVSSPGTIDQATGNMQWSVGWYGSFELQVRPVSCSGVTGDWKSRTIVIGAQDGPVMSVTPVGLDALPLCPIPAAGFSTTLTTGGQAVRWFINSPVGLTTDTTYVASATFFELPASGAASDTLELNYRPGFSGNIIISVEPIPCPGDRVNYVISVPVAPQITLTSGFNSNNITVCEDTAISTITYEIEGAANNVLASGLPPGLNFDMTITSQQTSISIDTDSITSIGQTYSISINNIPFSFTTTAAVANANDHIGQGLVDVVNAATNDFVLTYAAGNISIAVGPTGQSGNSFIISTTQPLDSSVTFGTPVANPLSKILRIFGTPSITTTRLFTINIETQAPQAGCETAIATATIIVNENSSITVEQGAAENNNVCGTSVFTGTESIILSYENALGIELSPSSPDLLPNGLVLTREVGSFNRFEISGTLNEVATTTQQFNVDFITTGANCAEATQRIIFNIEPTPVVTLTSTSSLGTNRAPCVSEEMVPIRFEIANPAFLLTVTPTGIDPFPAGIIGTNYAQNQITRVKIILADPTPPAPATTVISDTHTFIVNGTSYIWESSGSDSQTQLNTRLATYLSAQLSPTIEVTSNAEILQFRAVNPGFAFSLSTQSSSNLVFESPEMTQPPAYYEISGTPTEIVTTSTEYVYNLKSVGPTGDCSDSFSASGTITINPTASASFISGVGLNPVLCDSGIGGTSVFQAVGRPIGLSAVHTETWIIASLDQTSQEITITYNPPIQNNTSIVSFTYQFNLIGGLADPCASNNASITGVVYISPEDSITFTGISGEDAQIVCVNNDADLSSFIPVEFLLAGGATTVSTISFTQDGGVSQSGLPPGFSYSVIGDTVRITGVATEDAAVPTATSTVYEYLIETGPGLCASGNVTGTIEVVSEPTLALASSVGTDNQIICDNTALETIVYEMGGGATQSTLTFTGSNTLFGSGSFTANASGTNQYVIYGTPSVNVTESTIYSYQIQTVGSDCVSEVILTGSIQIDPLDDISLISSPTTNNQTVCFMDRDNTGELTAELFAPIEYQLIGGAIGDSVTVSYTVDGGTSIAGLPAGLGYETTASNTILISGSINVSTTFTASPTVVYTYSITTEGDCSPPVTVTGDITVLSPPLMSLVSSATTANQVICDGTPIDTITYEFSGGASMIGFNWTGSNTLLGSGISTSNFGVNQYIIQGTPTVNVTQSTIYTYEVVTVGSACVSEVVLTGSIQVEPTDGLSLISAINTDNQSICLFDRDNAGNAIAENFIPIEYQLEGGAIGATYSISYQVDGGTAQLGLPAGLGHSLTTSNTILIEGTIVASTTFSSPTVTYNYTITTNGSCVTDTISGNLTVYSPPIMTLTSAVTTTNQVGFFSVCNIAEPIADIVYTFEGGATNAVFSWTGPTLTGVSGSITSGTNSMVISGIPSVNIATTTQYPYQVTTEGSACASEVIYTGVIEVKPEEILTLASLPATENQIICAGTGSNTLDPIIYTLGQEATNAIVTFTPPIPGVGYTVSGTQVIISGVAAAAAQASKTILNYIYRIETTGCGNVLGSNIDGGTITILPTPVMELASGTPYFTVCQSDIDADIADVDYVFNPESNAIPIIAWDVNPGFNFNPVSGDTTLYRLSGAPSVNISSTTTYNYTITLSGDCDSDVVLIGAVTIDPGPQINSTFIENNLLTDISCFGANDGSIELGDPTGQDFLNSIQNINLGTVQESSVTFAGAITYDDIFRVTIDGTEYTTRGGEISAGTTITYTEAQVVNGLRASINNDPAQTNLFASQSGFGLNVNGLTEGLAFTISANTSDTSFVTNTVTTTTDAEYYAPQVTWLLTDGTTRSGLNIYDLTPGLYELNVSVDSCISTASFEIKEPTELSFTTEVCNNVLTLTASGSTIDPSDTPAYLFEVQDRFGRIVAPDGGARPGNNPVQYSGLALEGNYTIQLSTENCSIPATSFQMGAGEILLDMDNVVITPSYCTTGTAQSGSIVTSRIVGLTLTNALSGGSGYYDYVWTRSDTGAAVVYGVQKDLLNVAPGNYILTVTDPLSPNCAPKVFTDLTITGPPPVVLTGVETAQFIPQRGVGGTSTATVDYIYTLTCNGDTDSSFELRAEGGYPNSILQIEAVFPPNAIPVSGPVVSITNLPAGLYIFQATDTNPPSGLAACSDQITIRIEEPTAYEFELTSSSMPTCPEDLALGGQLVYTISGGSALAAPYTVSLNGGLLSAVTNLGNTVEFNGIDVTDPLFRTINTIEITDSFGCSSGLLTTTFSFDEVYLYELTNLLAEDIDCTTDTSGDLSFNISPAAINPNAPRIGTNNPAELHIVGTSLAYDRRITIDDNFIGPTGDFLSENLFLQQGDYSYTVSLNGTTTCAVASGTITINAANNAQLLVSAPVVTQPDCGVESQISLTISNEISPLSIRWYVFTTSTSSTVDPLTGVTTNATTTRSWVEIQAYEGFAILDNVPGGTYRAIISDARDSTCSGGDFVTPNIIIAESEKPYDVQVFSSFMPQCPEDLAIGGQLIYQITGVDPLAAPYTVSINGGLMTAVSNVDNRVEFSGIDVTNPLFKTIGLIEIVDFNGCSSEIITDVVFTFDSVYQYDVVNFSASNIDCSLDTSGELSFGIYPAAINTSAPQISPSNPAQLYIRGAAGNYEYYQTITTPDVTVDNFRTADEYFYSVTLNGTTTCAVASGTFTIAEENNDQLRVAPPEVTLPGCGVTESQIKLSITNAITPLSIRWYEFTSTTSSVIDPATGNTVNATTTTNWFEIPEYEGLSILNNVPSGIYRAIVSDSRDNSCLGGVFVTRNILISEGNISVSNFRTTENIPSIGSGVCKNYPTPSTGSIDWNSTRDAYTNDVFFNVNLNVNRSGNVTQTRNTGIYMSLTGPDGAAVPLNNPSIFGGRIVTNNGRYISLEPSSYPYRFRNLPSGNYTLIVEENVDGTDLIPCTEVFFFTVREYLPIQYTGDTVFVTDLCTGFVDGGIRAAATGGNPFIIDGIQTYQFEWTYTPNDPNQSSQVFYGELVERAMPGNYCLRILDQNGHSYCSCDANETSPVTIVVEDVVEPFSVQGTLTDPAQPGTLVRSLPPECSSGGFDGRIGIQITGGQLPYTIKWYVEDPRELASGDGYRELPEYQNSTSLQNLLPGNYKVEISSSINQCGGINAYSYFTDTIQVSPNRELYIMEGPFVDEDLCTGEQGRLIVDIFDNNNGNLSFYYNDILIPNSDVIRLSDRSWSIAIVNAVETADFRVANQEGCWITTSISRGIGVPNFTYTTPNFAASSIVLAREEITFENTSTDPFVTSEWIFGDNSTPQIVPTLNDSIIPVRHTYGVSGTYFTTLRLYNNIGCSEEITLPISVGKGYNIMVPNVFTPNNDLVNDNFKPLFSGFSNMTFTVYDYRGNVVYNEYVEESDLNNIQGISITGWDGSLAPYSPYFIYTAFGVLLDGETEVEKSGTFIVIN
ncbi:gliding motility-associated C-terminal domain-containing protein [Flavobacteriaceae bacterium]|nr:gliding motility-associated C-terminal domain-containing protein [Flavobacteriaceae bacterium]